MFVVVLRAESQDCLEELMDEYADEMAENGHILDTTEILVVV